MENKIKATEGIFHMRAYCSKCGKLLSESCRLSKKQLRFNWDRAVLGALSFKCDECGTKFPNFDIDIMVYNERKSLEFPPSKYIKLSKHHPSPERMFEEVSKRWHAEIAEQISNTNSLSSESDESFESSPEVRMKEELNKRKKYFTAKTDGEELTDRVSENESV